MDQLLDDPNYHGIIRSIGASGLVTHVRIGIKNDLTQEN
jgi:hypothetical protein